jgi:hypothetical protein
LADVDIWVFLTVIAVCVHSSVGALTKKSSTNLAAAFTTHAIESEAVDNEIFVLLDQRLLAW